MEAKIYRSRIAWNSSRLSRVKQLLECRAKGEITTWLKAKEYWNLDELVSYLDEPYGVVYQSKQSYYDLLSAAGISWKKSQKINPRFNSELVKTKRTEILDFLEKNQAEIETGQLAVFF